MISRFYKIIAYAALGSRSAFQAANDKQNQKDLRSFCLGWTMDAKENKQGKARLKSEENLFSLVDMAVDKNKGLRDDPVTP